MVKKLTKVGNSLALVIDKSILDLLNITADTPLRVSTTNGRSLQITPDLPEHTAADKSFEESVNWVFSNYDQMLKRLAE
jgi:antitoxin component of MazEF toxin-antitoxin module